jgi:hypothetical protein
LEHSAHLAEQHADRAEAAGDTEQAGIEREVAGKLWSQIDRMSHSPSGSGEVTVSETRIEDQNGTALRVPRKTT